MEDVTLLTYIMPEDIFDWLTVEVLIRFKFLIRLPDLMLGAPIGLTL